MTATPWPSRSGQYSAYYTSTNRTVRFAIQRNDEAFSHIDYTALTQWYNLLPDTEWGDIGFEPARNAMAAWIADFWTHRGASGLFPSEATFTPRKFYDNKVNNQWLRAILPSSGDSRLFTMVDTAGCEHLAVFQRMADFLRWFPGDPMVVDESHRWAQAAVRVNDDSSVATCVRQAAGRCTTACTWGRPPAARPRPATTSSSSCAGRSRACPARCGRRAACTPCW